MSFRPSTYSSLTACLLAWCCAFSLTTPEASGAETLHAGPAWDRFDLTLTSGERTEIAGPFYYDEQQETVRIWGVPPLLSYWQDPATDSVEVNIGYPVLTFIRYGRQYRWQLAQLLSFSGGPTQTENERHRFTLFPVYFQQRSSDPNENYTAYGPFYGHLKHRLMRDEISYVMFPLYSETRKKDVVTDNYLFPLFHVRHGDGLKGWQFWPLYGQEHKDVTTRTNGFKDVETIGGHDRWFALWPLFFNSHAELGTSNPQWQQGSIPAYSFLRSPARDSTTVLWPFFSRIEDREKKYIEWQTPWPLVVFTHGEGKTVNRVWPFYSHGANTNLESGFWMWPIYKYNKVHAAPLDRTRTRILFFLYSDAIDRNTENGQYRRRVDFWPFYTSHRDLRGNTKLQVLAPLEPFLPNNHNVEFEYAPLWSLWRSEKNAQTGASSQSLLWNLYRHDQKPESSRTSLFFGLYQSVQDRSGIKKKLFFIPIGASKSKPVFN